MFAVLAVLMSVVCLACRCLMVEGLVPDLRRVLPPAPSLPRWMRRLTSRRPANSNDGEEDDGGFEAELRRRQYENAVARITEYQRMRQRRMQAGYREDDDEFDLQ